MMCAPDNSITPELFFPPFLFFCRGHNFPKRLVSLALCLSLFLTFNSHRVHLSNASGNISQSSASVPLSFFFFFVILDYVICQLYLLQTVFNKSSRLFVARKQIVLFYDHDCTVCVRFKWNEIQMKLSVSSLSSSHRSSIFKKKMCMFLPLSVDVPTLVSARIPS